METHPTARSYVASAISQSLRQTRPASLFDDDTKNDGVSTLAMTHPLRHAALLSCAAAAAAATCSVLAELLEGQVQGGWLLSGS